MLDGDWLIGGGEMGSCIRQIDWSSTPLGPRSSWPQSLRTTVSLCLASNFPISIVWGPHHNQIYNDGYWPICGAKHPKAMGQDFTECWASAWPAIGHAFEQALKGETHFLEDQRMFLDRNGYLEETFFTFSFSPIRDESGGIGGLFHPVTETTARMLSERRTRALRDLATRMGKPESPEQALALTAQTLGEYPFDVPFVLLYSVAPDGKSATLAECRGVAANSAICPKTILSGDELSWPVVQAATTRRSIVVDGLTSRFEKVGCGPYPEGVKTALVLPITVPGADHSAVVLVAGVSPRLALDDIYRGFYDQLLTAALS